MMSRSLLLLSILALAFAGALSRTIRRQAPFNNFGPNWGVGQPWGQGQGQGFGNDNRPSPSDWNWQAPNQNEDDWGTPEEQTTTESSDDDDAAAQGGQTFQILPEGCNCPFTGEFNPVCGSDNNTYKNARLLNCYRTCGTNVFMRRMGACSGLLG